MSTSTTVFDWTTPAEGAVGWHTDLETIFESIDGNLARLGFMNHTTGEAIDQYEVCYYKFSDGKLWLADGDDEGEMGLLCIAEESKGSGSTLRAITRGRVTNASWTWTAGDELYVDPTTAGALTATRPSAESPIVAMALSSTEIFFAPLAWERKKEIVRLGYALAASANLYALLKDHTIQIAKVEILWGTTTESSDGANNWGFQLYNVTDAASIANKTTNGAEITADTPWDLGSVSNGKIDPGDVIQLRLTKTGTPTALAGDAAVVISYDRFIG